MSAADPPARPHLGLPPEQFAAAFPFHLAVDRSLALVQAGRTLERICPDLVPGGLLTQVFGVVWPEGVPTFAWLVENRRELFLLKHRASGLQLRGEFVSLPDAQTLLFLGSPWFTEASEIADRGLGFEDFAIHDGAVDLLQVSQAQQMALADARKLLEKLSAQRAELRAANERLRQQEAETRKLALIAAHTDNAVVLSDATGRAVWVNEGFTRLTGYTAAEILGKKPGSLLQGPGTDAETVRHIAQQIRKGKGFSEEILNYGRDGRSYWVAIEVQPIHDEEGRLTNFMAIEGDITARRAAQQRLAIQFQVSRVLSEANNLAVAVPQILQVICENLAWQVGQFWRLSGERLQFVDGWHPAAIALAQFVGVSRASAFERGAGLPGRVWATGQPVWIEDVVGDANFPRRAVAQQEGLHGAFAFPVLVRGKFWGLAEFLSRKIEAPDPALLETFAAVGNQIGQFIVRREAEEALRETSTLQRAILEGANYAIISTAPDGLIRTFNSAAERMLGYTGAEMVGRATPAIFHDFAEVQARAAELTGELGRPVAPGFEAFVARAALGQPDEREWTYLRKDGSRLPVLLSVTALFDEGGKVTGYLGVASDITERKRVAAELLRAKEAAETANRSKSDFLAMMSHEIRTPMNAVLGMTNLLLETPLDPRQAEYARIVSRSGEALMEIINDILDFSKIEAGEHFQLEEEVFSLQRLVAEVVQLLRPRAAAKGVALLAEVAPGSPDALQSDDGRLRQVLVNLVGNGVKFTDRGSVTVRVQGVLSAAGHVQLRFEVQDSGIGIGDDDLTRLFQPFAQADSSASRQRGGTGLGLAISKRIVELMGGRIGVRSVPGQGSVFWFELPAALAQTPLPGSAAGDVEARGYAVMFAPPTEPSMADHPLRILVAEDHDTNRRLALFMLESLGYRADFAGNGLEAVAAWARFDHDVILMDCQMPELDGFEATREIRRREAARHPSAPKPVRIIALTANALKGDRERCLAAGMDGYISKPFTAQALREALELRPAPGTPAPQPPAPPLLAATGFDPQRPAQLCADLGAEGVQAIIDDFLEDLPRRSAELQTLAAAGQWVELARLAHSLQGIGLSFGLESLVGQLRALETAAQAGERESIIALLGPLPGLAVDGAAALRQWVAAPLATPGEGR